MAETTKDDILNALRQIEDPDLHTYYDKVRLITRGPLFSWRRIKTIVAMNLGAYDGLVESYIKRVRDKAKPIKVP